MNCVIGNFNKSGIVGYNQCELLQKTNELSRACANNDDEEKQKYLNYLDPFNFRNNSNSLSSGLGDCL